MSVDIKQYLAQTGSVVMPPGMRPWPDENGYRPGDMSGGYVDLPTRRAHVMHGDWIVYEGDQPVGVSRTSPLPPPAGDLCALCGNTAAEHYSPEGHMITACVGFEALPLPVRELITRLRQTEREVVWLEEHLAYVMLRIERPIGAVQELLESPEGRGFANGGLRRVLARKVAEDA